MAWLKQDWMAKESSHSISRSIVHGAVWNIPPANNVPNQFTFVDIIDAMPLTWYWSQAVVISGMNTTAMAVVTNAGLAVQAMVNGVVQPNTFVAGIGLQVNPFPVSNGDNIQLGMTSALALGGHISSRMTVEGIFDDWDVTTIGSLPTINATLAVTEANDVPTFNGSIIGSPAVLATFAVIEEDDTFADDFGYLSSQCIEEDDFLTSKLQGPPNIPPAQQFNQSLLPLLKLAVTPP